MVTAQCAGASVFAQCPSWLLAQYKVLLGVQGPPLQLASPERCFSPLTTVMKSHSCASSKTI